MGLCCVEGAGDVLTGFVVRSARTWPCGGEGHGMLAEVRCVRTVNRKKTQGCTG